MTRSHRRPPVAALGLAVAVFGASTTTLAQDAPLPKTPPREAPTAAPKQRHPAPANPPSDPPASDSESANAAEAAPAETAPETPSEPDPSASPSEEAAPTEIAPVEALPVEAAPVETAPVETPADATTPTAAAPAEAAPVEAAVPAESPASAPSPEAAPTTPVFTYVPAAPRDERPEILPYVEGDAVPEGYRVDARMRRGLVIAGGVTFGVAYLASVGAALQANNDEIDAIDEHLDDESTAAMLYIPVVGPFIAAGRTDVEDRGGAAAVLVLDGLAQAAGLSMFVAGLAAKQTVLVKDERHSVALAPGAVGTATGLTALGTF